ncbi:ABC transporter permease [Hymenobacter humi]|uniref:ABC transporter permease n=1 Tax=Hymenobacter humi TaxID=1411620 RepID=A0ABW2U0C1_9BACT
MNSPMSAHFIDRYVRTLKTPATVALTSMTSTATSFANNESLSLDVRYTDGNFWKVTDFEFLDGRPFTGQEVSRADRVCVISEHTARAFLVRPKAWPGAWWSWAYTATASRGWCPTCRLSASTAAPTCGCPTP